MQLAKLCVTHPMQSKVAHTKHDDAADHDHGDNHVATSHYKMHTTCEVQTTCSMSKIAVVSVQTKSKCTKSLHCQTESTSRKSVSTQYTKAKSKKNELQKEFMDEKFQDSLCQFLSRTGQLRNFLNLTKGLVEETVHPTNMAWKAILHLDRYTACSSKTGMRYDDEYVEFLALLNMLYRSSVLNILRGQHILELLYPGSLTKGNSILQHKNVIFPYSATM